MNGQLPDLDICKTVLENGLTLLILEKHDVPLVTSTIWYRVGSAYERKGQTGMSHFLEHLMFKGASTYAKGAIDSMTAAYGGYNNAGTIFDYTMYYFNFSSDRWEIALDIEADRMRHCVFDPAEFEAERNVVLEELKHQLDSPWGNLSIQMEAAMYPQHPYQHPVIGWQEDLERITREEVIAYYQTYYVPNNAILVIVGDVATPAVIETVQRKFAHIAANLHLPALQAHTTQQEAEQRFALYEDTSLKRVQIAYHAATLADKDNYVLDVIDHVLSHGKTSRLYQRLIENDQLVSFIDTYNHPRKLPGAFYIFGALRPGIEPERVEQVIDDELERLQHEPLESEELQKVKNMIAADFIFDKETTSGLAHSLGEYELLHTYDYIQTYMEHLDRIRPEDIMRVAQQYLTAANRTVGWSLPEDPRREGQEFLTEEGEDFVPPTLEVAH